MKTGRSDHPFDRTRRRWYTVIGGALWTVILVAASVEGGFAFDALSSDGLIREVRIGAAAHDVDGLWSGESKEAGPDICGQVFFNRPLVRLLSAEAYPAARLSLNTRGDTSKVYGGIQIEWSIRSRLFLSTGLGLALHDGELDSSSTDRKSLGSRVLFRIPIEIGFAIGRHYRVVLAFDHISNAYLASPNEGMDTIGLLIGYRF